MVLAELFPYAHVLYNVLLVVYILTIVATIGVIVSENRNPVKSLAWVTVLILLPVLGLVLYLFFGRSLKGVNLISRRSLRKLKSTINVPEADVPERRSPANSRLIHMVDNLTDAPFFTGNDITVYTSGTDKFEALKRDIAAAKHYIYLQYYIFENDRIGREIAEMLIRKAAEGVSVHVMYDHVGSLTINAAFFQRMRRAGVEAHAFMKITLTQLANRLNWRNHRKIVVIDGTIGYIGGMNIADRYIYGDRRGAAWRDTHLRITGPAVAAMQYSFAIDWNFSKRDQPLEAKPPAQPINPPARGQAMQIVSSGPTGPWNNISFVFLKAIAGAHRCVYIQTPYFLPGDALLKALQAAALAGVDVRLMLPRKSDSLILRLASGSYLKECLLAGIKIYFYEPSMLHSKVLIVDDEFATTGSTNFDFRSFEHNFECNALVYSREFNRRLKESFHADQQCSTRIILSHWKRRPLITKAAESIFRLLAPIL